MNSALPLADLSPLDSLVEEVVHDLQTQPSVALEVSPGGGKSWLGRTIASRREDAILIEALPRSEVDVATDAAVQLGFARSDDPGTREDLFKALFRGEVLDGLGDSTVVVVLPNDWSDDGELPASPGSGSAHQRFRKLLSMLRNGAGRWVQVGPRASHAAKEHAAPSIRTHIDALASSARWGTYSHAAEVLAGALPSTGDVLPLTARLLVGAVHLGLQPTEAVRIAAMPHTASLTHAARSLASLVAEPQHRGLMGPVRRLLEVRRPVDPDKLCAFLGIALSHEPLVRQCLAYGEGGIAPSSQVRLALVRAFRALEGDARKRVAQADQDQGALYTFHRSLAVALDDEATGLWHGTSAPDGVESSYHAALAPEEGGDLSHLHLPEHFWLRGRYLSRVRRDFVGSARVFRACLDRYPQDDYAHHYLAFNLHKALDRGMLTPSSQRMLEIDKPRTEIRRHYQHAVTASRSNPWWNSRLVSWLATHGKPQAARDAWQEALSQIDPSGSVIDRSDARAGWLAEHLHYWVARAWLDAGRPRDALQVLDLVPTHHDVRRHDDLGRLRNDVLYAIEADTLGVALFSGAVPFDQRWDRPMPPRRWRIAQVDTWKPAVLVQEDEHLLCFRYGILHEGHVLLAETRLPADTPRPAKLAPHQPCWIWRAGDGQLAITSQRRRTDTKPPALVFKRIVETDDAEVYDADAA